MTDAATKSGQDEDRLIAEARANFPSFFRWVGILNDMIAKEIGPKFGLAASAPEVSVADGKVSWTLEASRPGKPVLSIPFSISGDRISFAHAKFEFANAATGQKSATFAAEASDDANRILSDLVQDYIG
ncbi:hypothetical protein [Methylocapsa aurea]|uniref:hypothetical protein n=1 Tax=Methylocapsa aurea TaxID=663610 RepID=UPI00055C46F7|nr:hypothetical protein [Methylocapsa aurea]